MAGFGGWCGGGIFGNFASRGGSLSESIRVGTLERGDDGRDDRDEDLGRCHSVLLILLRDEQNINIESSKMSNDEN